LDRESDTTIRRALIQIVGEYDESAFPSDERKALLPKLQETYRTKADPGLHASVEWLLRTWKEEAWLQQVQKDWARGKEMPLEAIVRLLVKEKEKPPPQWYINGQGQTMVVIPGPVEFEMGAPESEKDWNGEIQHKRRIGRTFAIAATA